MPVSPLKCIRIDFAVYRISPRTDSRRQQVECFSASEQFTRAATYFRQNNGNHSLVGHEPPVGLVERSHFHAVTGDHAPAVVRRTGPRHVRARLRHGNRGPAGRRVRRSCNANQTHPMNGPSYRWTRRKTTLCEKTTFPRSRRLENTTDDGTVTHAINARSPRLRCRGRRGDTRALFARHGVFL